jgi:hypothetical protein
METTVVFVGSATVMTLAALLEVKLSTDNKILKSTKIIGIVGLAIVVIRCSVNIFKILRGI